MGVEIGEQAGGLAGKIQSWEGPNQGPEEGIGAAR